MARERDRIPTGRVQRTAKVGTVIGTQGARYAGTRAANVVRSKERATEQLDRRHLEAAERMVDTLGTMKGAAMKIGQLASFIDTEFLPPEYRELYQEKLSSLRTSAPPMPWARVSKVLDQEWGAPVEELFEDFDEEAAAAASIGQVHRAVLPDGRRVAVKIQYPGVADALRADMQNAGMILRLAKAIAPGLDAKAAAEELKERVLEELDYEYEAQNQRTFARGYRGHPFIYVPDVISRLTTERVLVTEWVDGLGFEDVKQLPQAERDRFAEIVFRFCFGSIYHLQHFNADAHPGNYVLMEDGKVAFLDFGMTKQLDREQIELEIAALEAAFDEDPERLVNALHDLGFLNKPQRIDAERLMEHVKTVGGWYMEDHDLTVDSELVMRALAAITDPRSGFYDLWRRENVPANELMGRRMETGLLAVLGQLGATRNWYRIGREWWFAEDPATELGEQEWAYFEARGEKRVRKFAARGG
ncbi:MAG TPA: AarF/ABC1/UbiB kinase family protein [Thermoleophilaceae bacterium]|jgi:predicted unusual protein kinase regulating ubiquinone biosynthesis (AarF/ABC1/UbiB family)